MSELDKWQSHIDKQVREVIGDGNSSNLPGSGKPLKLEDDSHVPEDMRLANKIMRDNNVIPGWITLGQEIDRSQQTILDKLSRTYARYTERIQTAEQSAEKKAEADARLSWEQSRRRLESEFEKHNRTVLNYNLTIPPGIHPKMILRFEQELKKLGTST